MERQDDHNGKMGTWTKLDTEDNVGGFQRHELSVKVSDVIPLDRSLVDARSDK